jgi:hypothetical protein
VSLTTAPTFSLSLFPELLAVLRLCREQQMRTAAVLLLAAVALAACSEDDNIPAESSVLAKFVLTLSRPGAFNKVSILHDGHATGG